MRFRGPSIQVAHNKVRQPDGEHNTDGSFYWQLMCSNAAMATIANNQSIIAMTTAVASDARVQLRLRYVLVVPHVAAERVECLLFNASIYGVFLRRVSVDIRGKIAKMAL